MANGTAEKVKEIVAESVEFSENSPEPAVEELFTDVYINN